MGGKDYANYLTLVAQHSASALNSLPAQIPFAITTNGGNDFSVDSSAATIRGRGWIDVRQIRLAGSSQPLAVQWLDHDNWEITVPLAPGLNQLALEAYNHQNALVGSDSIGVTLLGDMDDDGDWDSNDADLFALALNDPAAYETMFGVPAAQRADVDQDGDLDFDDIPQFVALLELSGKQSRKK